MGKCYPVVSEDYKKAVDKCKRKLRGLIAEKKCAPLILRLAQKLGIHLGQLSTQQSLLTKQTMALILLSDYWSRSRSSF
ncbi:hypothetical protein CsSME_00017115 [Camellia sinensis var. sinensis]